MTMSGPEHFAKYPFLRESSAYIKEKGPSLDDILRGREYGRVRARGKERVMEALEKGEISPRPTSTGADILIEVLSYPVARIIVSAVNDSFLTKRYALAEAVRAHRLLEAEKTGLAMEIAGELGFDASVGDGDRIRLGFADYLHYSSAIRGSDWKLANQDFARGRVGLQRQRFVRLIQQAVQVKIEGELPFQLEKPVRDIFREDAREIKGALETHKKTFRPDDIGKLSVINLPPCMRKLLAMAQKGENIPHQGRFALTSFLHTLGMSADQIIKVFSLSPDFDPKKSRYQVEHITGVISSTEYSPPECSTMKTYSICFEPDDLCKRDWMTHPLKYYRAKSRRRAKGRQEITDETVKKEPVKDRKESGEKVQ